MNNEQFREALSRFDFIILFLSYTCRMSFCALNYNR